MATKEKAENVQQETENVQQESTVKKNAWDEKRSIFLPRAQAGQQKFVMVGVNGRRYQVPRGKHVEVPLPLYERLEIMLEAEVKAQEFAESIPNEVAPDMTVKRV